MNIRTLELTDSQRKELEEVRDRHPKPYMRERAGAIIKIAEGMSPYRVAKEGLLKPRSPNTVYGWLNSYEAEGIKGLERKPYSRESLSFEEQEELREMLHRSPRLFGFKKARWSLKLIKEAFICLASYTLSGIWRLLRRLKISYKRGRKDIHSPDMFYDGKMQWIHSIKNRARQNPERVVAVIFDEKTYYRLPSLCNAYYEMGKKQPKAYCSPGSNTKRRIGAALNFLTGALWHQQRSRIGKVALVKMLPQIAAWVKENYPLVEEIYLIWDCWPVHWLPEVLLAAHRCGIVLVPLPSYAPWEDPVEKVWKWLNQDILHMHDFADAWRELWIEVDDFLNQFADGSPELLRYVGLS